MLSFGSINCSREAGSVIPAPCKPAKLSGLVQCSSGAGPQHAAAAMTVDPTMQRAIHGQSTCCILLLDAIASRLIVGLSTLWLYEDLL